MFILGFLAYTGFRKNVRVRSSKPAAPVALLWRCGRRKAVKLLIVDDLHFKVASKTSKSWL
jgi:hypothetical protein